MLVSQSHVNVSLTKAITDVPEEKPPPLFLKMSSFSSGKCVIMRANTSFCNPMPKDYDNAISVFDNMLFPSFEA